MRWVMGLAAAILATVVSVCLAMAQTCDGLDVAAGADERRCIQPGSGQRFKDCADCPEMVVVPAGSFTMGSPPDEPQREANREEQVRVSIGQPFAVGAYS